MKLALQLNLIPCENTLDQVTWAKDHGVEGIELGCGRLDHLRKTAEDMRGTLPVVSVCGNCDLDGTWAGGFDFLDPDPAKRRRSLDGCKALLGFCGEVGAVGQIVAPIFGGPRVPDLAPFATAVQLEERLFLALLKQELAPCAVAHKTKLLLEPLNRYEQHYLRRQSDGVRILQKAKARGLGLLCDFFHMHIEEPDTPAALRRAGKHVVAIHLADNTRQEPGTGDIDFVAAFRALREIRFQGHMAYECGVTGRSPEEKRRNLAKSLDYLRACIAEAKGKVR